MLSKSIEKVTDYAPYAAALARVQQSSAQCEEAKERLKNAQAAFKQNASVSNQLDAERAFEEVQGLKQECNEAVHERSSEEEMACRAVDETMAKPDAAAARAYYLAIIAAGKALDELRQRNEAKAAAGSYKKITTGSKLIHVFGDPLIFGSPIHREIVAGLRCGAITQRDLPDDWPAKQIASSLVA